MHALARFLFVLVAVGSYLPASAAGPEQVVAKPATAAAEVAAAVPEASASPVVSSVQAAKAADASTTKSGDGQEPAVARVPAGYKAKEIDGEKVYCRKSTPLGSRFPTEVCMTVAQYEDSVRQRDQLRQELTGKQKSYSISR
ncbi:MAG: hypothetical protein IPJ97_09305 [Proteobacteria bacterium]|nr:hypothetical protein [Pseudomonadota bacterium]